MTLSDVAARISYLGALTCVISALGFLCLALVVRRLQRLEAHLLAMRLSSEPLSVEGDLPYREIEGGRFEADFRGKASRVSITATQGC
jgi:hypothetical protein